MCNHPWQEELSPGQSDSDEEKDGEDKVVKREKKEEGEEEAGVIGDLCQELLHTPTDLRTIQQ